MSVPLELDTMWKGWRCAMRRHVTTVALIVAVAGTALAAGCSSRRGPVNTGLGGPSQLRGGACP